MNGKDKNEPSSPLLLSSPLAPSGLPTSFARSRTPSAAPSLVLTRKRGAGGGGAGAGKEERRSKKRGRTEERVTSPKAVGHTEGVPAAVAPRFSNASGGCFLGFRMKPVYLPTKGNWAFGNRHLRLGRSISLTRTPRPPTGASEPAAVTICSRGRPGGFGASTTATLRTAPFENGNSHTQDGRGQTADVSHLNTKERAENHATRPLSALPSLRPLFGEVRPHLTTAWANNQNRKFSVMIE